MIMEQKNRAKVGAKQISTGTFYACYENSFMVTRDSTGLVAVDGENPTFLMYEDRTQSELPVCFGAHDGTINALVATPDERSLLAGDESGFLIQYSLTGNLGSFEHHYGHLSIGRVISGDVLGGLMVFGGDSFKLRFVDVAERGLVDVALSTLPRVVCSVKICRIRDRVMLTTAGQKVMTSKFNSDLIEITGMFARERWALWDAQSDEFAQPLEDPKRPPTSWQPRPKLRKKPEKRKLPVKEKEQQKRNVIQRYKRNLKDKETRMIDELRQKLKDQEASFRAQEKRLREQMPERPEPGPGEEQLRDQLSKLRSRNNDMQRELEDKDWKAEELRVGCCLKRESSRRTTGQNRPASGHCGQSQAGSRGRGQAWPPSRSL